MLNLNTHHKRNWMSAQLTLMTVLVITSGQLRPASATCGGATVTVPLTAVASTNIFFCSIAEAYFSGLTNGTSPTTYNPGDPVQREQMAAFIARTLDQSLKRGSWSAALNK